MTEFFPQHGSQYHTYPIRANDNTIEGSFKRYRPAPTPKDVFQYALLGMPKILPMTKELMLPELIESTLESAINEIEMNFGCMLSEVTLFHPTDYIDGMFFRQYTGISLPKWPATEIVSVKLKFPHTNTTATYQEYTIPPNWVSLEKNKVNIIASIGAVSTSNKNPVVSTPAGVFSYMTGFHRGAWQPNLVEVSYVAGFKQDKYPAVLADLIRTIAAKNFLADVLPGLFPSQSVNVSVDGISQGVSYSVPQLISGRLEHLKQKQVELGRAFRKEFGRFTTRSYLGV